MKSLFGYALFFAFYLLLTCNLFGDDNSFFSSDKPAEQPVKITRRADGSELWCYGNRCEIRPAKSVLKAVASAADAATPNRVIMVPEQSIQQPAANEKSVAFVPRERYEQPRINYSSQPVRLRLFRRK